MRPLQRLWRHYGGCARRREGQDSLCKHSSTHTRGRRPRIAISAESRERKKFRCFGLTCYDYGGLEFTRDKCQIFFRNDWFTTNKWWGDMWKFTQLSSLIWDSSVVVLLLPYMEVNIATVAVILTFTKNQAFVVYKLRFPCFQSIISLVSVQTVRREQKNSEKSRKLCNETR